MRARRTIRFLILSALIVVSWWMSRGPDPDISVLAQPQAAITITQPDGVDDVVSEGDDFATTVLGDPWDMSQPTDIPTLHGLPNGTISGGLLSYSVQSNPSEVPLLFCGFVGAMDVGKLGVNYPIDTDHYRWLSFRIWQPAGNIHVRWHHAEAFEPWGITGSLSPGPTDGWYTYIVDLETIPKGRGSWEGQVLGLYIISSAPQGTQVKIDWVRLTADNPVSNDLTIAWSGLRPTGASVDFRLDSDQAGCDGVLIHTQTDAAVSGSFTWQQPASGVASPANVAPGDYYVCARVNSEPAGYSAGPLTVNQAPITRFTQPSFTSSDDYAADAGNPWDMSDTADVDHIKNCTGYTTQDGVMAVNVGASQSDVQVYLNVPTAIDHDHYFYLTYRLWFDYPYTWADVGQVTRVFWGRAESIKAVSSLIYVYPGWQTYSVDLRSLELVSGSPWNTADWTIFRIDPIANGTGQDVTFYIDDIKLTGDEQADLFADIEWELTDPDSSATTMDLYYDTDNSGLNGTLIATLSLTDGQPSVLAMSPDVEVGSSLNGTLPLTRTVFLPSVASNWRPPCTGTCYTWDTSAVAPGTYYLYACVDDGYNRLCRYSERPLLIHHP